VPFTTASWMIEGGNVIIDESKLQSTPKLDKDE
jgi:hypothetical protein